MSQTSENEPFSPVEFLVHLTIDETLGPAVIKAQRDFEYAAAEFPGHLQSNTKRFSCNEPGKIAFIAVHAFDSVDHLIRWLESERRRTLLRAFNTQFKGQYQVHYPHAAEGLSAWLNHAATTRGTDFPDRWKTNLIVLTALYPLTLLLPPLLGMIAPGITRPTSALITAFVAVSALGFVLVPLLSYGLRIWLRSRRLQTNLIGATALGIVIAVVWQIACVIWPYKL